MNNFLLFMLLLQAPLVYSAASSSKQKGRSTDVSDLTKQLSKGCIISSAEEQLLQAAKDGDSEKVSNLLIDGADPFVTNKWGHTPLIAAAKKGHTLVIQAILSLYAHQHKNLLTATSKKKLTALDYARESGHIETSHTLTMAKKNLLFSPRCKTYFSPNILKAILNCISNEQESIRCAMFRFTHAKPAIALAKRKKNGVKVSIIIDKDYKNDLCLALKYMLKRNIKIREATLGSNDKANASYFNQHHKYLIFGKNKRDKPLLITGSCNFTHQGFSKNWENVIITDNLESITSFEAEHNRLKQHTHSKPLEKSRCSSKKDTDQTGSYSRTNNCTYLLT